MTSKQFPKTFDDFLDLSNEISSKEYLNYIYDLVIEGYDFNTFRDEDTNETLLHVDCNDYILLEAIKRGFDCNNTDIDNNTVFNNKHNPLYPKSFKYALSKKLIDFTILSKDGTVFHNPKYRQLLEFGIENGFDPNLCNSDGNTVFHCVENEKVILLKAIENGLDINKKNNRGRTILFDNMHLLKALINNGADINIADNDGNTILHNSYFSKDYLFLALENGFNPNKINKYNDAIIEIKWDTSSEILNKLNDYGFNIH